MTDSDKNVHISSETKAETGVEAVFHVHVSIKVPFGVKVEFVVLTKVDVRADAGDVPGVAEVVVIVVGDVVRYAAARAAEEVVQNRGFEVGAADIWRTDVEVFAEDKAETADEAVGVILIDFRAVARRVVVARYDKSVNIYFILHKFIL